MIYSVSIKQSAAKVLKKIALDDQLRIIDAIDRLKTSPSAGGVLKGEFSGLRRIRVGSYRVVYEVQGQELVVLVTASDIVARSIDKAATRGSGGKQIIRKTDARKFGFLKLPYICFFSCLGSVLRPHCA